MKLLLIDKDGTLIETVSGEKFVNQPWDQKALPGVVAALDRYRTEGWEIVIISNQGGIAAGHKSLESAIAEMQFCLELFPQIKEAYFCPDFQGDECWRVWGDCSEEHRICYTSESFEVFALGISGEFRKPNAGMLQLAIDHHLSDDDEVLYVGDRAEDEQAATATSVRFAWAKDFFNQEK